MSKSTRQGRQGKQSVAGATGKTGRRGLPRGRGKTGPRAILSATDLREIFGIVEGQLGEVSRELTAQMKRMGLLTAELEALRANVATLFKATI